MRANVVRVVDGDTVDVSCDGGDFRVRLIGIDAPESVSPEEGLNCPEGVAASGFLESLLPEGAPVYLEPDVSREDRYGRRLYYVWLADVAQGARGSPISEKMANAIVVRAGYARAKAYPPDTKYSSKLEGLFAEARSEGAGISRYFS